jgi:branched-chain amino acid transport system permease protein
MLYALLSLSVVILFKTTGQVNFAVGEVGMVAVFIGFTASEHSVPYVLLAVLVVSCGALISWAINRAVIRPMGGTRASHQAVGGVTLGISIFLAAMAGKLWDQNPHRFPPPLTDRIVHIGGLQLPTLYLIVVPAGVVVMLLMYLFLYKTRLGLQMRATADNPNAVRVVGVSPDRMADVAWAVAGALSAVAVLLLAPLSFVRTDMTSSILIKSFAASVVGGLASVGGAIVGGLLLGVGEAVLGAYFGRNVKDALAFLLVLVILMAKPEGLLGSRRLRRV